VGLEKEERKGNKETREEIERREGFFFCLFFLNNATCHVWKAKSAHLASNFIQ